MRKKKKNLLPDFAMNTAEGFYQVGLSVAKHLENDKSYFGFIGIMPAVVNFSLSSELFLKSVHMLYRNNCPAGHNIWGLYKNLPENLKVLISERYGLNLKARSQDRDELSSYKIILKRARQDSEEEGKGEDDSNPSIKALLLEHNNAFEVWRYLHEVPSPDGYEYKYDFKSMNAFILAVRAVAFDKTKERGPKMIMSRVRQEDE